MAYAMPQKFLNVNHHRRICQIDIFLTLIFAASSSERFGHQFFLLGLHLIEVTLSRSMWSVELRFAELLSFLTKLRREKVSIDAIKLITSFCC